MVQIYDAHIRFMLGDDGVLFPYSTTIVKKGGTIPGLIFDPVMETDDFDEDLSPNIHAYREHNKSIVLEYIRQHPDFAGYMGISVRSDDESRVSNNARAIVYFRTRLDGNQDDNQDGDYEECNILVCRLKHLFKRVHDLFGTNAIEYGPNVENTEFDFYIKYHGQDYGLVGIMRPITQYFEHQGMLVNKYHLDSNGQLIADNYTHLLANITPREHYPLIHRHDQLTHIYAELQRLALKNHPIHDLFHLVTQETKETWRRSARAVHSYRKGSIVLKKLGDKRRQSLPEDIQKHHILKFLAGRGNITKKRPGKCHRGRRTNRHFRS